MGILMLKIRRSRNRLIFNMGTPILVRQHLYVETPPGLRVVLNGLNSKSNNIGIEIATMEPLGPTTQLGTVTLSKTNPQYVYSTSYILFTWHRLLAVLSATDVPTTKTHIHKLINDQKQTESKIMSTLFLQRDIHNFMDGRGKICGRP